jgi:hypothetical protein
MVLPLFAGLFLSPFFFFLDFFAILVVRGLIDEHIHLFDKDRVSGNAVSCLEQDDVTDNDIIDIDVSGIS